jgi:hypothetical protein
MPGKHENAGRENAKVPDSEVQGVKAGRHNRAANEAGEKPPPAGESRAGPEDTPSTQRESK